MKKLHEFSPERTIAFVFIIGTLVASYFWPYMLIVSFLYVVVNAYIEREEYIRNRQEKPGWRAYYTKYLKNIYKNVPFEDKPVGKPEA